MPAIAKNMVERIIATLDEGISNHKPFEQQLEEVVEMIF